LPCNQLGISAWQCSALGAAGAVIDNQQAMCFDSIAMVVDVGAGQHF
jgi:hypothetical protein